VNNDDDVIARLQGYAAAHSIDDELAAAHASLMASAPVPARGSMRVRTMVAGGTLVAALLSGTGIAAAAGNLPDPVQKAAHEALKKVGVKVPKGTPVACEDARNHGQYVRSQPKGGEARSAAAKSDCGKKAKDADEADDADENEAKVKAGNEDKGKPDTTPAAEKSKADETPAADKSKADKAPVDGAADGTGKADEAPGKAKAEEHKPAK
jgi:hypothetical protein